MGKAALDLPDPLQAPPEGAKTSTDDLLAQLAGDEIDRLLAEADAAQPAVSRAPFHVGPPPSPERQLQPETAAVPSVAAPLESPKPTSVEMDVAAEMDALFSAATAKDEAAAAAAQAAVVARAAAEAEAETSAAERDGLKASAAIAADAPATQARVATATEDDGPLPPYLRPLEWLNAPLWLLPESARDIVGKIAIVTLINAAVILAYVLIVRRG